MSPLYFATASRGTEDALADELRELGLAEVEPRRHGVAFGERIEDAYRACLWSRVASRVLLPLRELDAPDPIALYEGIRAIDWCEHVGPERTLAVDCAGTPAPPAGPARYLVLKAKDAIVDAVREVEGARPDVDTERPDLRVNLHFAGERVTVGLDLAGRGLHRRGLGRAGAAAPLKENLAAALLRIAGWAAPGDRPLFDPLCGSATVLIEAAGMALDVAPGLARPRIGAEGWRGHDAALWRRLREEARARAEAARSRPLRIAGSDGSKSAVETARRNLERAGLSKRVVLLHRDLARVAAPWPDEGLVVTNPPYGARLGEAGELGPFYELLGDVLRRRFGGWHAWVLCGNPALAKRIGLRPASRRAVHNGPIECRFLELPISREAVASPGGPGWRRPGPETKGFERRLRGNLRRLAPWASGEGLTGYRLYDADVPQFNLAVDWYDGAARVEEYAPPPSVEADAADRRLREAVLVVRDVLGLDAADVVVRVRRRRLGHEQHERYAERGEAREVREGDLRFEVNLTDYFDTGLFLDDRLLRRRLREIARGRDVLNLFAYTCSASVAAAAGGARSTTSVDLSQAYLAWGRRNFARNGIAEPPHRFVRADAVAWLADRRDTGRYGAIYLAPPTHSRSKAMRGELDLRRDHARLVTSAAGRLAPGGEILLAVHARDFDLDERPLAGLRIEEITASVTPPDFAHRPRLRAWTIRP